MCYFLNSACLRMQPISSLSSNSRCVRQFIELSLLHTTTSNTETIVGQCCITSFRNRWFPTFATTFYLVFFNKTKASFLARRPQRLPIKVCKRIITNGFQWQRQYRGELQMVALQQIELTDIWRIKFRIAGFAKPPKL